MIMMNLTKQSADTHLIIPKVGEGLLLIRHFLIPATKQHIRALRLLTNGLAFY
jgi:hypothetical protein